MIKAGAHCSGQRQADLARGSRRGRLASLGPGDPRAAQPPALRGRAAPATSGTGSATVCSSNWVMTR